MLFSLVTGPVFFLKLLAFTHTSPLYYKNLVSSQSGVLGFGKKRDIPQSKDHLVETATSYERKGATQGRNYKAKMVRNGNND